MFSSMNQILKYLLSYSSREPPTVDNIALHLNMHKDIVLKTLNKLSNYCQIDELGHVVIADDKKVELVLLGVKNGLPMDQASILLTWHDFETFIMRVLDYNDFLTVTNLRINMRGKRREIDIIGCRNELILCIDAKHWMKTPTRSVLTKMVEAQKERVTLLSENLRLLYSTHILPRRNHFILIPLVVTLFGRQVTFINNVPIIPCITLNNFLLNYDFYLENIWKKEVVIDNLLHYFK
ncbi:MAG: hypothetical protein ACP6IU_02780 [Candidatus Asgardarchaeia archaeon]